MRRWLPVIMLVAACLPAFAADTATGWELPADWSQAQRERYHDLLEELRCPVCQNQSLESSGADLADDLRSQVRKMIGQGKSDQEIKDYLVARYGNFVLYDPPVTPGTWLLWGGPVLLLLIGLALAWAVVRRSRSLSDPKLSDEEHERAQRYLDEHVSK